NMQQNNGLAVVDDEKAEDIALKEGEMQNLGDIYFSLSSVYKYEDDGKEKAIHYAQESLRIHRESGSRFNEINSLQTLAGAYFHYDDYTSALKYAEEALRLAKGIANTDLIAHSYSDISSILYCKQQYEKSAEAALAALEVDSTNHHIRLTVYSNLPVIYARLGNFDLMEDYFDRYREAVNSYSNESFQQSLSGME